MNIKGKLIWRCRILPGPLELRSEVWQVGEILLCLRLFAGEVVECVTITPEQSRRLFLGLMSQGWHTEQHS